jgi:betaine-aldehyde dehydrogenase
MGGPFDEKAETGPLISAEHRDKVTDYVNRGIEAGARLRVGGHWGGEEHNNGYFYAPTVLDQCTAENPAVVEEGFGPVITVETFSTEAEAIAIANDTDYGLAGAVWSSDSGVTNRVSRKLRHGTIWINDYHPYLPQAEWGGFKQSGIGRELGVSGLEEYMISKHIYENTEPAVSGWFPRKDAQ